MALRDVLSGQLQVSIRPQYVLDWPRRALDVQQCCEDAFTAEPGQQQYLAAILSGCGHDAADVALAARSSLAGALQAPQEQHLTPDDLVAAFQHCHDQLLQQSAQLGPQQQQLNISHSGASCLLVYVDQDNKQLLAASAGLCHAVMARSASEGKLTVLELSPRLALGYNVAETSRLDAVGSSICYSCDSSTSQQASLLQEEQQQPQDTAATTAASAAEPQQEAQLQLPCCPEPVLVGPNGMPLPGVQSSRLLGYRSASTAGVVPTPVVTSWRLSGEEAFIVLGSPGLWAAMNPAEVVDYVAAALASGACSTQGVPSPASAPQPAGDAAAAQGSSSCSACVTWDEQHAQDGAAQLRPDAAALLGDLLTLEAQERLKLRLTDISTLLGGLGASGAAASARQQVVPDVTAAVLLLPGPLPAQKVPVNEQLLKEQLSHVTRGCRSNVEAQALQASWYSLAGASICSSSSIATASYSSNSSSSIATASMSSSADSTCSTGTAAALVPAGHGSGGSGCEGIHRAGEGPGPCPAQSTPCPALSCLLPALTVAGHCWPSTFWPSAAVTVPAAVADLKATATAAAAGSSGPAASTSTRCLAADSSAGDNSTQTEQSAAWGRSSGGGGGVSRPIGFTLSQRLSIELDVTHRPGSSGSIGSLAAQCAAADAADVAGRQLEPLTSPTPSDEQAVIVHKVRLSGPNELESLLFGNATTAFPDTTVARILKPQQLNSSGSGAGLSSLAHAYSWAAPGGLAASGHGCYSTANTASSIRQQQRVNGWTFGGWAAAGAPRPVHAAPSRSASVNIALLSRQPHSGGGGGGGSCSSSAASSQSHGSLKAAGGSCGYIGRDCLSGAGAGVLPSSSRSATFEPRRTSLETLPSLAHKAAAAEAAAGAAWPFRQQQQQQQQPPLLRATGGVFQQALQLQSGSLPAPIQGTGRVSKARSYQALSALQAAGSAELCDSLAAAAAQAAATHKAAMRDVVAAAASADAVSMLNSRSSGDGGLFPRSQQQMHFRPAFRSAVHSTSKGAPFALQQRFSDSAALAGQQHRPAWSLSAPGDAAAGAQADSQQQQQGSPSILAQAASLAESLAWDSSSDHELPEGKVRGGLARSRSSSLQTLTLAAAFAEAGAAATQASACAVSATPAAPAAAATAQLEVDQGQSSLGTKGDSLEGEAAAGATRSYGQADSSTQPQGLEASLRAAAADNSQLQDQYNSSGSSSRRQVVGKEPSEQCVRGGHTKASRLKHSASSPELVSLTAARASGRTTRRASLVLPPTGIPPLSSSSSSSAALNASLQQPVPRKGSLWGSSSLPRAVQNSNALSITAEGGGSDSFTAAVSPFAADITGRSPSLASLLLDVQQQQQAGVSVGVSAFAGAAALSPQGSRELTEGSYGADGAVHGGELGEQALEGQMHGGRRSKSLSVNSLLTSSLPSSADDDDNTLTSSLSPNSRQQQQYSRQEVPLKASHSYSSSLSCSSSIGGRQQSQSLGRAGSQPLAGSTTGLMPEPVGLISPSVMQGPGSYCSGLPVTTAGEASPVLGMPGAGSSGGGNGSGSIEVLLMASGSFTKVRFAASAPAGAPGEQLSSAVDSITDSPVGLMAGAAQHHPAGTAGLAAMLCDYSSTQQSASQPQGSSAAWGTAAVKGWSSPERHVIAFSSSAGSSDGAALRSSTSMPGATTGLNNSPLPAAPRSAWSSSRAWGGKAASRKLSTSSNLFARANFTSPAAAGQGLPEPASTSSSMGAASQGAPPDAGSSSSAAVETGVVSVDAAAAAAGALLSSLPSTKRQRSAPLPTLQESPAPTPGSSPGVSFGFTAAYEETLARHKQQQEQQPQVMMLVHDSDEPEEPGRLDSAVGIDVSSSLQQPCRGEQAQLQQRQQGSFAEHSATGLVTQSLSAEASRRSTEDSGSGRCTPGCSSQGVTTDGSEHSGTLPSDSFEFSRPQGGDAWDHSPLLGKILQG